MEKNRNVSDSGSLSIKLKSFTMIRTKEGQPIS